MDTMILQACEDGNLSAVIKLVKKKVNINVKDAVGESALTKACKGKENDLI